MKLKLKPKALFAILTFCLAMLPNGVYAYNDRQTLGLKGDVQSIEIPASCTVEELPFIGAKLIAFNRDGSIAAIDGVALDDNSKWTITRDSSGRIANVANNAGTATFTTVVGYDKKGRIASITTTQSKKKGSSVQYLFYYNILGWVDNFVNSSDKINVRNEFKYGKLDSSGNWIKRSYTTLDGTTVTETRIIKYWQAEQQATDAKNGTKKEIEILPLPKSRPAPTTTIANKVASDGTEGVTLTISCGLRGSADRSLSMNDIVGYVHRGDPDYGIGQNETKIYYEPSADYHSQFDGKPWYLRMIPYLGHELETVRLNGIDVTAKVVRIPPKMPRWPVEICFLSLGKITTRTTVNVTFKPVFCTSDLRVHDLLGHVKSVRWIDDETQAESTTYGYSQQGAWTTVNGIALSRYFKQVKRNAKGQIISTLEGENDQTTLTEYTYSVDGYVVRVNTDFGLDGYSKESFYYDMYYKLSTSRIIENMGYDEPDEPAVDFKYKILEYDGHTNWTRRQVVGSDGRNRIERRIITYWE